MTYYRFNYIKVTLFACDVVFVKIQNVLKRRRKSKLNGLGGQTSFWVAGLQYEFQWAICSDGGILNGFLNKSPIFPLDVLTMYMFITQLW